MTETATAGDSSEERTYDGVLGAFPYAFRASDSRLFRSYVALGGIVAFGIVLVFALALVKLLGDTVGSTATLTFSRSFYIVVALAVVAPIIAPVLLVARRHRRTGSEGRYDRALAAMGYLFIGSLYVLLVISTPEALQEEITGSGPVAATIRYLYDLPRLAGLVPPAVVATAMYLLHRWLR